MTRVSDERLAELRNDGVAGYAIQLHPDELAAICEELIERRAAESKRLLSLAQRRAALGFPPRSASERRENLARVVDDHLEAVAQTDKEPK